MIDARLTRFDSSEQGTVGELVAGKFRCFTMEPPWKDNRRNLSSIPPGVYPCQMVRSARYGEVYAVTRVPGRSAILIHAGNIVQHTKGCILPGARMGKLPGPDAMQLAVLLSRVTLRRLVDTLGKQPFLLEVVA
jgi:hypothetical protein